MKKNFLLAMFVMLMTSISSFAQDQKEYNMVITLNNGTTVTLGHNDIKEITFNDGAVSISGNMVNTIDSLRDVTRYLQDYTKALNEETRYIEDNIHETITMVEENKDGINKCKVVIQQNRDAIDESQRQINELEAQNTILTNNLTNSQNAIVELNQVVAVQNDYIKQLNEKIAALESQMNELHNK